MKKTYPPFWRSHIAPVVRFLDNYTCVLCRQRMAGLHVHHVDKDTTNNNLTNLVSLCPKCHRKAENNQFVFCQLSRSAQEQREKALVEAIEQAEHLHLTYTKTLLRASLKKPI